MFRLLLGVFLVSGLAIAADPQKGEPKRKPKVKPDYAHPFAASYRVNDDELFATIREQSTQVAEATLAEQAKDRCFLRTVCAVGTLQDNEVPRLSMASGIMDFKKLLEEMIKGIENNPSVKLDDYPNIHRTLASFTVGSATKSLTMCDQLFACGTPGRELVSHSLRDTPTFQGQRTTCTAAGALCPGVSIGCALCGVFSPGTCGQQCIIAGLYCGLSAYACKAEAPPADTPDAAETRMMTLFNERMHNDRVREDAAGQRHKNNLIKFFLGGNRK